ncbi:MAG: hypothetical protein D6776_01865 [Planctomycetota bacterium]|nr:MAG: hypothetical protein D6776_01865 [Planctomycetota bacterium]
MHALRLGDTVWIAHAFEYSAEQSRRLKQRARKRGYRLQITSSNGTHHFYVVPEDAFDEPGYEGGMTAFGPGLTAYLDRITEQLGDALAALGTEAAAAVRFDLGAPGESPASR